MGPDTRSDNPRHLPSQASRRTREMPVSDLLSCLKQLLESDTTHAGRLRSLNPKTAVLRGKQSSVLTLPRSFSSNPAESGCKLSEPEPLSERPEASRHDAATDWGEASQVASGQHTWRKTPKRIRKKQKRFEAQAQTLLKRHSPEPLRG